jgi:hypothetical protein
MQILTKAQAADSIDNAVLQVKLGRVLMFELKYREAEQHAREGYEDLLKQGNPQLGYIHDAEGDLEITYAALKQPREAQEVREELTRAETAEVSSESLSLIGLFFAHCLPSEHFGGVGLCRVP